MARSDNKSVYQFTSDPNLDTEVQLGPPTQPGVGWYNGEIYTYIHANPAGSKWEKKINYSGVLIHNGTNYAFSNDSQHESLGVSNPTIVSPGLIGYNHTSSSKVSTCLIVPDDNYAQNNIFGGESVGLSYNEIKVFCNRAIECRVYSNGSNFIPTGVVGWWAQSAADFTLTWDTSTPTAPFFRYEHPNVTYQNTYGPDISLLPYYGANTTIKHKPVLKSWDQNGFEVYFIDETTNTIATTQSAAMDFYFVRRGTFTFTEYFAKLPQFQNNSGFWIHGYSR